MAKGESGRVVIEVDPLLKRELYAALALSGSTLKDWFIHNAHIFCSSTRQAQLFVSTDELRGGSIITAETTKAERIPR